MVTVLPVFAYLDDWRNRFLQGNLTIGSFGLICIAIALGSCGQICLKLGLGHRDLGGASVFATFFKILHAMANPYILIGLACYVVSTFFWILVLSKVRLSVAYPMISMGYVIVVILSSVVLREHMDWRYAGIGLLCICAGVSFIGFGLGQMGGK